MRFLLDSHIAAVVAEELGRRGIDAIALAQWMGGTYRNAPDELILAAAHAERRVFVTYDRSTIPPLLRELAESGRHHGGVILISERTLRSNDVGGLVKALEAMASKSGSDAWEDRVVFFTGP